LWDGRAVEAVLAFAGHRARSRQSAGWPAGLSDREVQVLRLVATGHSNKAIGSQLGISHRTAQHHVIHIYDKIGVSTRAAAALFASEHGII
jgi:DNA-binding NarL/FixJ family response regulator